MIEPGKHKLTEALEGQTPPGGGDAGAQSGPAQPTGHGSTPREVAEETRRNQEAQNPEKGDANRDDHLVRIGRGHQTHG